MSTIRSLHVLDHSLPLLSGYTIRSHYLIRSQRRWGISPTVVTSGKHGDTSGCDEIDGVCYHRAPVPSESCMNSVPGLRELHLMQVLARQVYRVAQEEGSDVIHAHSPVLNAYPALWAARRLGVPVVYEIRAFWEDAAVDHGTHGEGSLRYRTIRGLETWIMRRVDALGVISAGLEREVLGRGIDPKKVFRIPNGVDVERFQPNPGDSELTERWELKGKLVFGFMGSFYRYEGVDLLLRGFAPIAREFPNTCLVLVGGGEALSDLRRVASELGLEDRIRFVGSVPHEEITQWYSVCDVLVYPRRRMRLTELVTPLKPLEAMACGRVVVASDVGGLKELVEDQVSGLLFDADDVDELSAVLRVLATKPELRRELGARARDFVCRERNWANLSRIHAQTYQRLLKGERTATEDSVTVARRV